jgi:hypothetical protein
MTLRGFAYLKPLPSHLVGRTLALRLDDLPRTRPLPPKRAPRAVRRDVFGMQPEQAQRGHDGHGDRACHAVGVFRDLMRSQAHDAFEFLHQQCEPPPSQIPADNVTGRHHLRQMGHEALRLFRPLVAPTWAQDHGDLSQMAPPRPCGIDPQGPAALGVHGRHANRGLLPARPRGDEGVERLPAGNLPGAGEGDDVPRAPRVDQRHMGPGRVGGIGDHADLLAPGWRPEILAHLPTQGRFRVVARRACARDQGDIHGEALDVPLGHADDAPTANDLRMVPVEARVLGHRMRGAPLAREGVVAHQRQEASLGWRKSLHGVVGTPPQPGLRAPGARAP